MTEPQVHNNGLDGYRNDRPEYIFLQASIDVCDLPGPKRLATVALASGHLGPSPLIEPTTIYISSACFQFSPSLSSMQDRAMRVVLNILCMHISKRVRSSPSSSAWYLERLHSPSIPASTMRAPVSLWFLVVPLSRLHLRLQDLPRRLTDSKHEMRQVHASHHLPFLS